jgi:short-subunit dehydrogenase
LKVIIITGASEGIGAEMARQLAARETSNLALVLASSTKFAMTGFFESLRVELAPVGVSVTIAYPGVVATEVRRHGFDAAGKPAGKSGREEAGAMSVEECARLIVEGMKRRRRDVMMTAKGKLGRWIKLIAPAMSDRIALAALSQHARPR